MKKVLNKRSNDTSGGYAKSPTTNNLEYGEIAVNYHDGVEKLFIKNDYNQIVSFPTDEQVTAGLNEKQDVINDLSTIRSGAALGATAVQTETDPTVPSWAKQSSKPSYSYDEITGTEEKKTNQEFVYRQSPTTIKAKTVSLDRIYGKTLAWNQLQVKPLNATPTYFYANSCTLSYSNGVFTMLASASGANANSYPTRPSIISGHKYYSGVTAKGTTNNTSVNINGKNFSLTTSWAWYSLVDSNYGSGYFSMTDKRTSGWDNIYFKDDMVCVDLTLLYGSDIDGLTNAQILEKFESEYPGYHDYSAGKLISNDAAAVKTVGFNLWDEEWENGDYSESTGEKRTGPYIRSRNRIPVLPNQTYFLRGGPTNGLVIFEYDSLGEYLRWDISTDGGANNRLVTMPSDCHYITFRTFQAYGTIFNHDVCINFSDPTKNGTYEPYRESTMQLGLDSIKVKSHNIWDEEWEAGSLDSNGQPSSGTCIRSKNYIPCTPNTDYHFTGTGVDYHFYDTNYNHISMVPAPNATSPSNAAYIKFRTSSEYGTTYKNDICLNVSSSFNGQYDPYGDNGVLTMGGGVKVSWKRQGRDCWE